MTTCLFCTNCGSMLRPLTACRKGCTAPIISGSIEEAIDQQSAHRKAQESARPAKPVASVPVAAPVSKPRDPRPYWQRKCTCGHCMSCIGE